MTEKWHTEPPTEDDIRGIDEENEYCFALCLFYDQWYLSNYLFKANIKEQCFETETDKGEVIKFQFSCNYPWMRIEPYND